MKARELQVLRKFCMLNVREAAEIIGKVSPRSWQYWGSGRSNVPDDIESKMVGIIAIREEIFERLRAKALTYSHDPQNEHSDRMPLPYYETFEKWQAADECDGGVIAWRCYQSVVCALYAGNLVNLDEG